MSGPSPPPYTVLYFDILSTQKMITPHLLDLSLSVSLLCSRCMTGHNHRCHTHTQKRLKIMRLFWEYYNAGNNTDNDDDNFTMSVTFFFERERDDWMNIWSLCSTKVLKELEKEVQFVWQV